MLKRFNLNLIKTSEFKTDVSVVLVVFYTSDPGYMYSDMCYFTVTMLRCLWWSYSILAFTVICKV